MNSDDTMDDESDEFALEPAASQALARAAAQLIDDFLEDLESLAAGEHFRDTAMSDCLPRGASLKYDATFARRFAAAAIVLGYKLVQAGFTGPSSTAEELVLHAVIARARDELGPLGEDDPYADFVEVTFQDTDVLLLFDPAMDGVEKSDVAARMGFANLKFEEWFEPFGNATDVPAQVLVGG